MNQVAFDVIDHAYATTTKLDKRVVTLNEGLALLFVLKLELEPRLKLA